MRIIKKTFLMLAVSLTMVACTGSSEVDSWLAQQKASNPPTPEGWGIEMKDDFSLYEFYRGEGLDSPLSQEKLDASLMDGGAILPPCILEQIERKQNRPEPLESYPLNALKAVGYIKETEGQKAMALIQVGTDQVFEVYVGQFIGQDYGRITSISETDVHITEILHTPGSDVCNPRSMMLSIYGGAN